MRGAAVLDAILGNVGTLLLFRLGALDAEQMAPYVRPELSKRDLEDLPDHQVAARLLVDGRPTRPFVLTTCPASPPAADPATISAILAHNHATYTRPAAEVEEALLARRRSEDG